MNKIANVVVVMARCSRSKQPFGIRFEEKTNGRWLGDWAFAIKEDRAKREGYDRGEISGTFAFDEGYPGCPFCKVSDCFKCTCGKVACWDPKVKHVTCPWCGAKGKVQGEIESLDVGGDR